MMHIAEKLLRSYVEQDNEIICDLRAEVARLRNIVDDSWLKEAEAENDALRAEVERLRPLLSEVQDHRRLCASQAARIVKLENILGAIMDEYEGAITDDYKEANDVG